VALGERRALVDAVDRVMLKNEESPLAWGLSRIIEEG